MDDTHESRTKSTCAVIASSVLCVLVLVAVVYGAKKDRDDPDTPPNGGAVVERPSRGGARPDFTDPSGCGSIDPDHPPRLELLLPPGGLDFGPIKQGVVVALEVEFRNAGEGTLCVLKVSTGCGCLKAALVEPNRKRFGPGEGAKIRVTLDSTDREGEIVKSVKVTTNEIDAPIRSFDARADISRAIVVAPPKVLFGRLPRRTPSDGVLTLRSPKDDPEWSIRDVVGTRRTKDGSRVVYTFDTKPVDDPKYRKIALTIHHPGLLDEGVFRDPLVITTSHPERPEIIVQSFLEVVPRIAARPPRVSLGYVRSGSRRPPTKVRLVPGSPEVEFEVEGIDVEPMPGRTFGAAGSGFTTAHGRDSGGVWVDVAYDGSTREPGLMEAIVIIHTTDEFQPDVRIRVSALVRTAS